MIKDCELEIHYHPSKANVVAHALSRKSQLNMLEATELLLELLAEFEYLNLGFVAIHWVLLWMLNRHLNRKSGMVRKKMRESRR